MGRRPKHERIKYESIGKRERKLVMYVLSRLVVNSMNNITSAKNGGGDAWHERREHHGTADGIMIKSQQKPSRKGMRRSITNVKSLGLLVIKSTTSSLFIIASNAPMPRTWTVVSVYVIRGIDIKVRSGSCMLIAWERCQERAVGWKAGHRRV